MDQEPEVNITTTPQTSDGEYDETSSLENNDDGQNQNFSPLQSRQQQEQNDPMSSCVIPQSELSQPSNDLQPTSDIEQLAQQRDIGPQDLTNQSELLQNGQQLRQDMQQQQRFAQDFQVHQHDISRQQMSIPHQNEMQQKTELTNEEIPFDISSIQPKATIKLEPGINATQEVCSNEWNSFNGNGNDVGELTTMQPFSYYKSAFDANIPAMFDPSNNYQIPNKNNALFDPMFARLNDGDELHPFDTTAVQSSASDNFQQNKNSMYNYGPDYTKTTPSALDCRSSTTPYQTHPTIYNREHFSCPNNLTRSKSCDDPENPSLSSEEKVIVPEDPSVWTTEHVQQWIDWAVKEYQLRSVDKSRFATLTGIELCTWTMDDFTQICGEMNANCLLGHLNFLRRRIIQKTYPQSIPSPNGLSTINYNHNSGGSYVACKAVRHGSKVVFCSNDEKQGKAVEKEINAAGYGGEATFVFADVTKETDVKLLVQETINKYGLLNCVINNAGYHPPYQTIDDISKEDFTKLFDLNVVGYFLISKYALPHLRKTEGNIINIASMDGHHAAGGSTSYVATKGAVLAMTRALAIDEAKYNVRVNSISPGATSSPLLLKMVDISPDPEQQMQRYKDVSVLGRIGQPEEIGMTALYLSADATFCTGIDIQVSGGTPLNYADKNMRKEKTLFI